MKGIRYLDMAGLQTMQPNSHPLPLDNKRSDGSSLGGGMCARVIISVIDH